MTAKRGAKDRFPSILEDAFHDPENCSIDPVVKVAISDDHQEYTWALSLLPNKCEFRRDEAGVFFIGLLLTCGDNWKKRLAIVEVLYHVQTEHCVNVLFDELKRVRNTNSTRRYLRELVSVLSEMPAKLVRSGFEALAEDKSFSHRMRSKFEQVLDFLDFRERHFPDAQTNSSAESCANRPETPTACDPPVCSDFSAAHRTQTKAD